MIKNRNELGRYRKEHGRPFSLLRSVRNFPRLLLYAKRVEGLMESQSVSARRICESHGFPQGAVRSASEVGAEWEPARSSGGCLQRKLGDALECEADSRALREGERRTSQGTHGVQWRGSG